MSDHPAAGKKNLWHTVILLVYPFLLAYYPVFALRNHNIVYVDLSTILRTLILVTAGTAVIAVIAYLLVRNLEKSSVIVSLIVLLFLSYGHLYILLGSVLGNPVRHRFLAGAEGLILLGVTILVLKKDQLARALSQFLAVASIVLLAMVVFESVRYDIGVSRAISAAAQKEAANEASLTHAQSNGNLPDFYLIVLDAHTRSDVLASRFGYDNSSFIRQLGDMGFYVSSCSQSNYASTKLSLVSALYGDYVQNIVEAGAVLPPFKTSTVNQTLKSLGYKTIAFENRASGHFDLKEDILLSRNQMAFGKFDLRGGFGEFERMMIDTSFMRFVVDTELFPGFDSDTLWDWELREHYYQTQYILTELEKVPEIPGPKFVYAHIMVPHSPFVFAPDGSYQRNDSPSMGTVRTSSLSTIACRPPCAPSSVNRDQPRSSSSWEIMGLRRAKRSPSKCAWRT
jgi:hypothetical protein